MQRDDWFRTTLENYVGNPKLLTEENMMEFSRRLQEAGRGKKLHRYNLSARERLLYELGINGFFLTVLLDEHPTLTVSNLKNLAAGLGCTLNLFVDPTECVGKPVGVSLDVASGLNEVFGHSVPDLGAFLRSKGDLVASQEWDSGGPGSGAGVVEVYEYDGRFSVLHDAGISMYETAGEARRNNGIDPVGKEPAKPKRTFAGSDRRHFCRRAQEDRTMILHVPHSSRVIPPDLRPTLRLSDADLARELLRMTDAWTDELFPAALGSGREAVVFPVSRLVVDPERFEKDDQEPMALKGMGAVYMKTSDGTPLRHDLSARERSALILRFYRVHHDKLEEAVEQELLKQGRALIVDCHSFPTRPLPFEDPALLRPEICVGIDGYHTPPWLGAACIRLFEEKGYEVAPNTPFSGSLVPSRWFGSEPAVHSIMIEVRRDLSMDENTGERLPGFSALRDDLRAVLGALGNVVQDEQPVPG